MAVWLLKIKQLLKYWEENYCNYVKTKIQESLNIFVASIVACPEQETQETLSVAVVVVCRPRRSFISSIKWERVDSFINKI
jgi:hypothetical protein